MLKHALGDSLTLFASSLWVEDVYFISRSYSEFLTDMNL